PQPVVKLGEFVFSAVRLDHGHIYGMCNGLTEAGGTLKYVYDPDKKKVAAFLKAFPQARAAKSEEEMLEDLQLPAYLKLLEDSFPPEVARLYAFVSFSADKTQEKVYTQVNFGGASSGLIEETIENILQSEFENIFPNRKCEYCPYRTLCELSKAERIPKIEEIIGCRE
ncbi:PD-(D/E)XK nuclease family protein, partial [bacterium]|nr:PD-(D/E)XK nuclease family protein [bacterium]